MRRDLPLLCLCLSAALLGAGCNKPNAPAPTTEAVAQAASPTAGASASAPAAANASAPAAAAASVASAPAVSATAVVAASAGALCTVVDGNKVDANTLEGFRTWRAAACDRCHGPNQEGLVGPSLLEGLKTLTKEEFVKTLKEGRLEKGMPSWTTSANVMANIDNLYAYLKGRSDGAITQARVTAISN